MRHLYFLGSITPLDTEHVLDAHFMVLDHGWTHEPELPKWSPKTTLGSYRRGAARALLCRTVHGRINLLEYHHNDRRSA